MARQKLHAYVLSGTQSVVDIQKRQAPWKTVFWNMMSIVGSHDFFLAFFPMVLFGFGCISFGGRLVQRVAMGIYIGNIIKDYLCLPRPPCPPVTQLNNSGNKEFGLPSTHAVTAICLPFFTVFAFIPVAFEATFIVGFLVAAIYMYMIVYSRLYLGMHSPADLMTGLLIGLFVLIGGWIVETLMEAYSLALPAASFSIFVLYGILLLLHPEPHGPCPCFEDSACFLGSAAGVIAGVARCTDTNFVVRFTPTLFVLRWVISSGILFAGRAVYKPLVRKIAYMISDNLEIPRHSYVYPHNHKTSDAKPFISPKWDIHVLVKYIVYYIIAEHCLEFSPYVFTFMGWW